VHSRAPTSRPKLVQTLAKVENPSNDGRAGATEKSYVYKPTPDARILEYAWWLKKQGYSESTITGRVKLLKLLLSAEQTSTIQKA